MTDAYRVHRVAETTWAVTHRGRVLARYEESVDDPHDDPDGTVHYRVCFPDGRVRDTRETLRTVVGWDRPSVAERIWWDYTGRRPMTLC